MIEDFLDNGKWKCTKCGACCHFVKWFYPDLALPDGKCKHLKDNNECEIYETRPEKCRSERKPNDDLEIAKACNIIKETIYGTVS